MLVPETIEPELVQMMDINMLIMTGGRERTALNYGDLCAAAGVRLDRTTATGTPSSSSKPNPCRVVVESGRWRCRVLDCHPQEPTPPRRLTAI